MIDINEMRKAITRHGTRILNEDEVTELLDRLEAAEKELESWKGVAKQFGNEADELRTHLSFAKDELNRLRAKIEAMEKQEPYAFAVNFPDSSRVELVHDLDDLCDDMTYEAHEVRKLYLAPAQKENEND